MLKESEVYTSISNVTYRAGVLFEIVVLAVLKDEYASFFQYIAFHYKLGDVGKPFECIRWVGKDKVIALGAALYEAERVVANYAPGVVVQGCTSLFEMCEVQRVNLY